MCRTKVIARIGRHHAGRQADLPCLQCHGRVRAGRDARADLGRTACCPKTGKGIRMAKVAQPGSSRNSAMHADESAALGKASRRATRRSSGHALPKSQPIAALLAGLATNTSMEYCEHLRTEHLDEGTNPDLRKKPAKISGIQQADFPESTLDISVNRHVDYGLGIFPRTRYIIHNM